MDDQAVRRSFLGLHLTLAVVAMVQSGQTLLHAAEGLAEHHLLLMFGVLQLVAAVLFLIPRSMRIGGIALVVLFVHAALYEATRGAFPAAPLVFAAAALFVTLHGTARGPARSSDLPAH